MKVYIPGFAQFRWDAPSILGAFSTFEHAKAACEKHAGRALPLQEDSVGDAGCYADEKYNSTYYDITCCELDQGIYLDMEQGE